MKPTLEKLSPWLFTIGMFVLWELVCRNFKIDTFVLPAPSQIFQAVGQYWLPLAKNAFVTLWTTLVGFALAVAFGIVLGIIMGWSRAIYRGLYPVMIGFNSVPKVAVVPILIITPLTFLGGTFYSINVLPPIWQTVALCNPVVYLISGFRWSFFETADVSVAVSLAMTVLFLAICLATVWWTFKTGYRLKK